MEGWSSVHHSTPVNSWLANTCFTWWCGTKGRTSLVSKDSRVSPLYTSPVCVFCCCVQGVFPSADQPATQRITADSDSVCQRSAPTRRCRGEGEAAPQCGGAWLGDHAPLQLQTVGSPNSRITTCSQSLNEAISDPCACVCVCVCSVLTCGRKLLGLWPPTPGRTGDARTSCPNFSQPDSVILQVSLLVCRKRMFENEAFLLNWKHLHWTVET